MTSSDALPLSGVSIRVRSGDVESGYVDRDVETLLGETDDAGSLRCPLSAIAGSTITARAGGFLVNEMQLAEGFADRLVRMNMQRAARLDVVCRTRAGQPVGGVEISLSRAPLEDGRPPAPDFSKRLPVASERALHTATTDDDGRAVFDMLPAGRAFVQLYHPHYCWVSQGAGSREMTIARAKNQREFTFDPLVVAGGIVTDDTVLSWSLITPDGAYIDAAVLERTRWWGSTWAPQTDSFALAFAGAVEWHDDSYAAVERDVAFKLLTASHGACTVRVPVVRADEWAGAHQIQVGVGRNPVPSSMVRFVLSDADSRHYDFLSGISLRLVDARGFYRVPLGGRGGTAFRLPNGEYEVLTNQPFLEPHIEGQTCSIQGEGQLELKIPMPVRECRFEWGQANSDRLVDDGVLTLTWRGETHRVVMSHGLSSFRWTMPVGEVGVSLESEAGTYAGTVSVAPGAEALVIPMRVSR
ncbi:MAG: hypothetical protein KAI24_01270 [Planctomycetes bacterium]|nr:hypothetical protein [Planctomycetota bacterium]